VRQFYTSRQRQRSIINIVRADADKHVTQLSTSHNEQHPSLYLLNATSVKKPHAMQQLITDIHRGNYVIVFITETWLSSKRL